MGTAAMVATVDSADDPRLADYRGLRQTASPSGVLIAEGLGPLGELVRSRFPLRSVLCLPARLPRVLEVVAGTRVPVLVAERPVLATTVGFNLHRGVVAAGDRLPPLPVDVAVAGCSRVAVVEGGNDHENLGALFRNAAAFGVGAVLADPTTADPWYRRSIRVSMGQALRVPFARLDPWPAALGAVQALGFTIVALTPAPGAIDVDDLAATLRGDKVAFLLGAEGPGLSAGAMAAADLRVRIPIAAGVDSLNVATAAAVAFHVLRPTRHPGEDRVPAVDGDSTSEAF
jgi:tRNA G18 (ribose-2'-O)-methylase SpoU